MKPCVAILGSTSHIGKGLIQNFLRQGKYHLHVFTRSPVGLRTFLRGIGYSQNDSFTIHVGYSEFLRHNYGVLVNCIGIGTLKQHGGNWPLYFTVTEKYDNLAIAYLLRRCPEALYISLSSGAVYGGDFREPAKRQSSNNIPVNCLRPEHYYSITRVHAEAKHRSYERLNIVDLRIFSYFSRFLDITSGYFMADLLKCILQGKTLITDPLNQVRDYLHPQDLFSMVLRCIQARRLNHAFDVSSAKPAAKKAILHLFSKRYGLKYELRTSSTPLSATGPKFVYYSRYNESKKIGYQPRFSSLGGIEKEAKHILKNRNPQRGAQ